MDSIILYSISKCKSLAMEMYCTTSLIGADSHSLSAGTAFSTPCPRRPTFLLEQPILLATNYPKVVNLTRLMVLIIKMMRYSVYNMATTVNRGNGKIIIIYPCLLSSQII